MKKFSAFIFIITIYFTFFEGIVSAKDSTDSIFRNPSDEIIIESECMF